MFAAERDWALGADSPLIEHWISTPPHVAAAWEAMAWGFRTGKADYEPSQKPDALLLNSPKG